MSDKMGPDRRGFPQSTGKASTPAPRRPSTEHSRPGQDSARDQGGPHMGGKHRSDDPMSSGASGSALSKTKKATDDIASSGGGKPGVADVRKISRPETDGTASGDAAAIATGAASGAKLGSAIPVVGNVAGGVIGGTISAVRTKTGRRLLLTMLVLFLLPYIAAPMALMLLSSGGTAGVRSDRTEVSSHASTADGANPVMVETSIDSSVHWTVWAAIATAHNPSADSAAAIDVHADSMAPYGIEYDALAVIAEEAGIDMPAREALVLAASQTSLLDAILGELLARFAVEWDTENPDSPVAGTEVSSLGILDGRGWSSGEEGAQIDHAIGDSEDFAAAAERAHHAFIESLTLLSPAMGDFDATTIYDQALRWAMGQSTCSMYDGGLGTVAAGTWVNPMAGTLTSGFGMRKHPISGVRKMHAGQDIAAGGGTPIVAAAGGEVIRVANDSGGYGNWVEIDHGGGVTTRYAHMQNGSIKVQVGQSVPGGTHIGNEGSTGGSTGNHLHFEVRVNGEAIDPVRFMSERGVTLGTDAAAAGGTELVDGISSLVSSPSPVQGLSTQMADGTTVNLDAEQVGHAATIVAVGTSLGVPADALVISLMTALQESSLRNLNGGDRDSVGLFQQRPSAGWGTVAELTTPEYAARAFFGGPSGPNGGSPRGLLDIAGWEQMALGAAAQKVQVSAHPSAYDKWETAARDLVAAVRGTQQVGGGGNCGGINAGFGAGTPLGPEAGKPCRLGSTTEVGLQPATVMVYRATCNTFPQVTTFYGFAKRGTHGTGHSLDIMISGEQGRQIAAFLQANAAALQIQYLIYEQKIWNVSRPDEGWRQMADRGSVTQNHYDHVHVTVIGG